MKMWAKIVKYVLYTTFTTLPVILSFYIKHRNKNVTEPDKSDTYDFILITHKNRDCESHVKLRTICSEHCSTLKLKKLVLFFAGAKNSISICMYLLTLKDIVDELISCHKRGIKVRLITDHEMIACSLFGLNRMKDAGIQIKTQSDARYLMHHKFAIVDANKPNAKVLYGSLNLSMQALLKNFENSIISSNPEVVDRFNDEFEHLWHSFDDINL